MKNMKRVLALVLVFALSFTMMAFSATAFTDVATSTTGNANSIDPLNALGVFKGYEDGTFKPDQTLTREQFAAIAYRLLTGDTSTATLKAPTKFPDVKADRWSSGFVAFATEAKPEVIKGYTDGTFKPDNKLTVAEMGTMLVRVLGYEVTALSDGAARAFKLGLINSAVANNTPATRGMAADAVYAAMGANYLRDMLDGDKATDQPSLAFTIFKVLFEEDVVVKEFNPGTDKGKYNLTLRLDGAESDIVVNDVELDSAVDLVGSMVNVVYKVKKADEALNSNSKIVSITKADSNVEVTAKFADFDVDNALFGGSQTNYNTFKVAGKTFKYGPSKVNNVDKYYDTINIGTKTNETINVYMADKKVANVTALDLETYLMGSKADGTITVVDYDSDGIADIFKITDFTFTTTIDKISPTTKDVTVDRVAGTKTIGKDIAFSTINSKFGAVFAKFIGSGTDTFKTTGDDKAFDLGTITEAQVKAAGTDGLPVIIRLASNGIFYATTPATVTGRVTALVLNNKKTIQLDAKDYPMLNEEFLATYAGAGPAGSAFWSYADNKGTEFTITLNGNGVVVDIKKGANVTTTAQGNYGIITAVDTERVNLASSTGIGSADWTVRIEVMTSAGAEVYNTSLTSASGADYTALETAKDNFSVINLDYDGLFNSKDRFDVSKLEDSKTAANAVDGKINGVVKGADNATAKVDNSTDDKTFKYTTSTLKLENIKKPVSITPYQLKDGVTSVFYVVKSTDSDGDEVITVTTKTPSTLASFKCDDGKTSINRLITVKDGTKDVVDQIVVYVDNTTDGATANYRFGFFSQASVVTEDSKNVTIYEFNEIDATTGEKKLVTYKTTSTADFPALTSKTKDYMKSLLMYEVSSDGKIKEFFAPEFDGDNYFTDYVNSYVTIENKVTRPVGSLELMEIVNNWTTADSSYTYIKLADDKIVRITKDTEMFAITSTYDSSAKVNIVVDMSKVTDVNTIIAYNNDDPKYYANAFISYKTGSGEANYEATAIYFVENKEFGTPIPEPQV